MPPEREAWEVCFLSRNTYCTEQEGNDNGNASSIEGTKPLTPRERLAYRSNHDTGASRPTYIHEDLRTAPSRRLFPGSNTALNCRPVPPVFCAYIPSLGGEAALDDITHQTHILGPVWSIKHQGYQHSTNSGEIPSCHRRQKEAKPAATYP